MTKVTLKKTGAPQVGHYGSKGKRMVTPASYDIFLDGVKVGALWGYCQTRLADGGCGHKGKAFGVALSSPGVRGTARKNMEAEIAGAGCDKPVARWDEEADRKDYGKPDHTRYA